MVAAIVNKIQIKNKLIIEHSKNTYVIKPFVAKNNAARQIEY